MAMTGLTIKLPYSPDHWIKPRADWGQTQPCLAKEWLTESGADNQEETTQPLGT